MKPIEFTFNERKAAQAASRLLQLGGGEMNYLALMKLLYLVDREALITLGKPVTGDRVVGMKHGPVLRHDFDLVSQKKQQLPSSEWHKFIPRPEEFVYTVKFSDVPEFGELSPAEMAIIQSVFARFSGMDEWDLVEETHKLAESHDPKDTSVPIPLPIPFEDILRAAHVPEESIQAIAEDAEADRTMEAALANNPVFQRID